MLLFGSEKHHSVGNTPSGRAGSKAGPPYASATSQRRGHLRSNRTFAFVVFLATSLWGLANQSCTGQMELFYGRTLCDETLECPEGKVCLNGVCVPGEQEQRQSLPEDEEIPVGDWTSPPAPADQSTGYCRVDAQCDAGELCIDGQCVRDPCSGVTCGEDQECRTECRPTQSACDGVDCPDVLEHCLGGGCAPSCFLDPCTEGDGCVSGDACDTETGECDGKTNCLLGECVPSEVTTCQEGDTFCPSGTQCIVECVPKDPCKPNPCNPGWRCVRVGDDDYSCVALDCAGVSCLPGEICVSGNCVDPCVGIPCELGGREGCGEGEVCCDKKCCPADFLCRDGECVPPDVICNPACEEDEYCLPDGCYCGPQGDVAPDSLEQCGEDTCCLGEQCRDPCAGNPCQDQGDTQGCRVDCSQELGYTCFDLCEGVSCEFPETCDSATGRCSCGGENCAPDECCIGGVCKEPCDSNTCGDSGLCEPNCDAAPYYECVDLCADKSCPQANPDCDPTSGGCSCDGVLCDAATQCCTSEGCISPCAGDPCGISGACEIRCNGGPGTDFPEYRECVDNCAGLTCETSSPNPDCDKVAGECVCRISADDTEQCEAGECCGSGGCEDPCSPNPCTNAPKLECRPTFNCDPDAPGNSGPGYECVNPCPPDLNCDQISNGSNPVCDPLTGDCVCDPDTDETCESNECCINDQCIDPCASANCGDERYCRRDCTDALAPAGQYYQCVDACQEEGVTDAQCQMRKPNLECDGSERGAPCECNPNLFDDECRGDQQCCVPNPSNGNQLECLSVCAGNPCASQNLACYVDCFDDPNKGYRCADACVEEGVQCNNPREPYCDPITGACTCGGGASCRADECCTTDDETGACYDPCASQDCGSSAKCYPDCSQADDFYCANACMEQDVNCPNRNPDCDPATGACGCSTSNTGDCDPGECCTPNGCENPCDNNPCSVEEGECQLDCSVDQGYQCVDNCDGSCEQPNPQCRPTDGECFCGSDYGEQCGNDQCCEGGNCVDPCSENPCDPTEGECVVDCSAPLNRRCESNCPPASGACEQPNPACYPPNGDCYCGSGGNQTCATDGTQCCLNDTCESPCADGGDATCSAAGLACYVDCSDTSDGFTCDDACDVDDVTCSNRNPDCNPETGNCRCGSDFAESCGSNECCVGGDCEDPCADNPCENPDGSVSGKCVQNCSLDQGYECINLCVENNVTCEQDNYSCYPADGECYCGGQPTVGDCAEDGNICCPQGGSDYICKPAECTTCPLANEQCVPCSGCQAIGE